jgi:hypothetical protein
MSWVLGKCSSIKNAIAPTILYGNIREAETDLNMHASLWLREGEVRRGALLDASESGRAIHRRAIGWLPVRVY